MTVRFFVRSKFSDGNLRERMAQEGLPQELQYKQAQNGRIERVEYTCSSDLALAMLRAGADLEFTVWDTATLEYKKTIGC